MLSCWTRHLVTCGGLIWGMQPHPSPLGTDCSCLQIRELVPESQAYMDLLAFERKLDQTIARKRMEIQEAIKKPLTVCGSPGGPHQEGEQPAGGLQGGRCCGCWPSLYPPALFSCSTAKAEAEDLHLQHFHPSQRRRGGR